jgi:3-deoxy-D-manno-octulosonic acid kinase
MKHVTHKEKLWAVVHDAGLLDVPGVDYFSDEFWRARQALSGAAVGRGSAWFIEAPCGPVVLRHYLRGGWAAVFSRQAYFFTSVERSRPFREYHVLAEMHAKGLPVPRPVAALCQHHGMISTGAIMTLRIPSAKTLADVLTGGNAVEGVWANVGRCIRRFHDAGAWHADLNARNILLDEENRVFLIDFDRARFNPETPVNGEGNLSRLKRSLLKLWPKADMSAMEPAWIELMAGYDE